jgi:predicted O-methyltransferase YrrM
LSKIESISFILKNRLVTEKIRTYYQNLTNKKTRKKFVSLSNSALSPEDALSILFPTKNYSLESPTELEEHLDNFIQESSQIQRPENSKQKENSVSRKPITSIYPINWGLGKPIGRFLYTLCLASKPSLVLETGVANGFSSSYILAALEKNQKGKLISIDHLIRSDQTKENVGIAIPNNLKKRHSLILGNSIKELKKLLNEPTKIDIFLHDSLHTYNNMMKEYQMAWPHISKNGFLLSDDIAMNDAFFDFTKLMKTKVISISNVDREGFFGVIKKNNS